MHNVHVDGRARDNMDRCCKIARMVNTTMPLKLGMKVLESLHINFQEVIIISSSGVNSTPYGGVGRTLEFKERSLKGLLEGVTVVNAKELKNFVLPP